MFKSCIVVLALFAVALAKPVFVSAPVAYTGLPVAAPVAYTAPAVVPTATSSQYVARNYNALAAPYVAAPYVAAAPAFQPYSYPAYPYAGAYPYASYVV